MSIRSFQWVVVFALLTLAGGCGTSSTASDNKYVETPQATYSGLKGQHCAVMVWADWRTRTEYNQIQLDTARLLTGKLQEQLKAQDSGKKADAVATHFTLPASVVRYQREHPEIYTVPVTEVAPRLNVTRLVYIELEDFSAQSAESIMILKGFAKATLRIVEVADGKAKVVFEEAGITAHYPPDAPEGVMPTEKITVRTIYEGTLDLLTDKLAVRIKEGN
jgi:hypothetical protein